MIHQNCRGDTYIFVFGQIKFKFNFTILLIYRATGYTIEPTLKKIQDEETEQVYREAASISSMSDSANKTNKNKYNYRDEVMNEKSMLENNNALNMFRFHERHEKKLYLKMINHSQAFIWSNFQN